MGRSSRDLDSLRALAAIVRNEPEDLLRRFAEPGFDAESFARFLASHRLAGYAHAAMEGLPAHKHLPRSVRDRLASAYLAQWANSERLATELVRLARAFEAASCPFLALKGHALTLRFYGDIGRRGLSDLDLLVTPENRERACHLLESEGFVRRSRVLVSESATARFTHAFEFVRDGVEIDLHWVLARHSAYRIDYGAVWATSRPFRLNGVELRGLADEYALTFQAVAVAKDVELGTIRLNALVDLSAIARTLEGEIDWDRFFAARERERLSRTCLAVLGLMLDLFGVDLPRLREALGRRGIRRAEHVSALLDGSLWNLSNRLWAAHLYETSLAGAFCWWALSLPFRVAAHGRSRSARPSPGKDAS